MSRHVNTVVKSSFYHLRNIAKIRDVLTLNATKILIHAFVLPKTDNYNLVIYGLPKQLIDKLQHLLNAACILLERLREPKKRPCKSYSTRTPLATDGTENYFKINLITDHLLIQVNFFIINWIDKELIIK